MDTQGVSPECSFDGQGSEELFFVCYLDILGFRLRVKEAYAKGTQEQLHCALSNALDEAYRNTEPDTDMGGFDPLPVRTNFFTDNAIISCPAYEPNCGPLLPLSDLLHLCCGIQAELAVRGFFVRGGIAIGEHRISPKLIFGDALLKAHCLENRKGAPPRIQLHEDVTGLLKVLPSAPGEEGKWRDVREMLARQGDGSVFLNYLHYAVSAFPDAIYPDFIKAHRDALEEHLNAYRDNEYIWSKYKWSADYHDWFCKRFADAHPVPYCEEGNEYASACRGAQEFLGYLMGEMPFPFEPYENERDHPRESW